MSFQGPQKLPPKAPELKNPALWVLVLHLVLVGLSLFSPFQLVTLVALASTAWSVPAYMRTVEAQRAAEAARGLATRFSAPTIRRGAD